MLPLEKANEYKNTLIITAAGKGTRFNKETGKIFYPINNTSLIIKTIKACLKIKWDQVIITIHKDNKEKLKELCKKHEVNHELNIIEGGATRLESVQKAVNLANHNHIVIHDGARPYISESLLRIIIQAATQYAAVIPTLSITDTIKEVRNNIVMKTISRQNIVTVQTPQAFKKDNLMQAYKWLNQQETKKEYTDEAMLLESMNQPIHTVTGERQNIKITTTNDL